MESSHPQASLFRFLEKLPSSHISALLMRESDRVCAVVLSRLSKVLAVKTLADFSPSRKRELLLLMKSCAELDTDMVRTIADELKERASHPSTFRNVPASSSASTSPSSPDASAGVSPLTSSVASFSSDSLASPSFENDSGRVFSPASGSTMTPSAPTISGRFAAVLDAAKKTEETPVRVPQAGKKKVSYGGPAIAAAIIRMAGPAVRRNLRKEDPELFKQLMRYMYTFDDLVDVDDSGLQVLLTDLDTRVLACALKAASPRMRDRFLKNMTPRRAALVDSELENMAQVRLSDIESSQDTVLKTALSLQEHGRILIDRDADVV